MPADPRVNGGWHQKYLEFATRRQAVTAPLSCPLPAPLAVAANPSPLGIAGAAGVSRQSVPVAPGSGEPVAAGSGSNPKSKRERSPEEDALLVWLRSLGMKWVDIKKYFPGRNRASCAARYQYYCAKYGECEEKRKNELAWEYER
ncbi:hypothetical protein L209DRAFT_743703 [Thermothelomyces heterothallicus CBS 203.75]